jgi:hypothetical protein
MEVTPISELVVPISDCSYEMDAISMANHPTKSITHQMVVLIGYFDILHF